MRIKIYCPDCARAGIKRWLMDVDGNAVGIVYPYCKGCKENKKIELKSKKE